MRASVPGAPPLLGARGPTAIMVEMTVNGRITTPFGFETTAAEVVADVDLGGKRAIVTGAGSGIGVETVRALAGPALR